MNLLLDQLPPPVSFLKGQSPEKVKVFGEGLFKESMVRALLGYSDVETIFYVLDRSVWPKGLDVQEAYPSDRLVRVLPNTLPELQQHNDIVIFTNSNIMYTCLPLRKTLGRSWPICGLAHSVSALHMVPHYATQSISDLDERDALICSTESSAKAMAAIFEEMRNSRCFRIKLPTPAFSIKLIPLGVTSPVAGGTVRQDLRARMGWEAGTVVVLCFGRLTPRNKSDLAVLLLSVRDLSSEGLKLKLIISGDDTQHNWAPILRSGEVARGLGDKLSIIPNPDNRTKSALFCGADIFVGLSTTFEESFGIAVAEAMLAGIPVIASDWDGFRHLVEDGVTGFLVPTYSVSNSYQAAYQSWIFDTNYYLSGMMGHDYGSFRTSLKLLVTNQEKRLTMGAAGRKVAESKYLWSTVIPQYEELWKSQLSIARKLDRRDQLLAKNSGAYFNHFTAFRHYPSRWVLPSSRLMVVPNSVISVQAALALDEVQSRFLRLQANAIESFASKITELSEVDLESLQCLAAQSGFDEIQTSVVISKMISAGIVLLDDAVIQQDRKFRAAV